MKLLSAEEALSLADSDTVEEFMIKKGLIRWLIKHWKHSHWKSYVQMKLDLGLSLDEIIAEILRNTRKI